MDVNEENEVFVKIEKKIKKKIIKKLCVRVWGSIQGWGEVGVRVDVNEEVFVKIHKKKKFWGGGGSGWGSSWM